MKKHLRIKLLKSSSILLLSLFSTFSAFGEINLRDSVQYYLNKQDVSPRLRFFYAHDFIFYHASPEEAEDLGMNMLYPYAKKLYKDDSQQKAYLSYIYKLIALCYRDRGKVEDKDRKEMEFWNKCLESVEQSDNDTVKARMYTYYGYVNLKRGTEEIAHDYLYKSIPYYEKLGMYTYASEVLYTMAATFYDIKDAEGMEKILEKMQECLQKDASKQSQYQFNVIKEGYYNLLLERQKEAGAVDYALVDSVVTCVKKNIELVEQHRDKLNHAWVHAWAYFYYARALNNYFPDQYKDIYYNLEKALEELITENVIKKEPNSKVEVEIYVYSVYAKARFRQGLHEQAYRDVQEALSRLDDYKNYNTLIVERSEAYELLVQYYELKDRPAEALKYQKLLQENETRRYNNEKLKAINEMAVKYETEKKEAEIQALQHERDIRNVIIALVSALSLLLLIGLFLLLRLFRIRKEKLEQEIYEKAMVAEMKQSELECIREGLRLSPARQTIKKLSLRISDSRLEAEKKSEYEKKLQQLDYKTLDKALVAEKDRLTNMDMIYIICFVAEMETNDISFVFNVDPASVRTVRYRIKKKIGKESIIASMI